MQDIDEVSGLVTGFQPIDTEDGQVIYAPSPALCNVAAPPVYAFANEQGYIFLGTLDVLAPHLLTELSLPNISLALKVAILELVGERSELHFALKQLCFSINDAIGFSAARSFVSSCLYPAAWRLLIDHATGTEAAANLLRHRTKVFIFIGDDGSVEVDLSRLPTTDYQGIDAATIADYLVHEFNPRAMLRVDIEVTGKERHDVVSYENDLLDRIMRRLRHAGRQEERLAIYLSALRENPALHDRLSRQYNEKALFAKNAKEIVDTSIRAWATKARKASVQRIDLQTEVTWRSIVSRLIKEIFPLNRGVLLFYLAKHLGKYPEVSSLIRSELRFREAENIEIQQSGIEAWLDAAENDGTTRDLPERHQPWWAGVLRDR